MSFGRSISSQETTLFTNIEIARDKVTIESGMRLWQISTPDNIGCFSPQVVFAHLFFSLCFHSGCVALSLFQEMRVRVRVCVRVAL